MTERLRTALDHVDAYLQERAAEQSHAHEALTDAMKGRGGPRRDPKEPGKKRKELAEQRLAAVIRDHFRTQRLALERALEMNPPAQMAGKADKPSPGDPYHHALKDEGFLGKLYRAIMSAVHDGVNLFKDKAPVPTDDTPTKERAAKWANAHAAQLEEDLDTVTRKIIDSAVQDYIDTPGLTLKDLVDRLPFDDQRALNVAVTETTGAYARANLEAGRQIQEEYPDIITVKIVFTNQDDRVCPICKPLDGEEVEIGQPFSTGDDGPPFHVNCRCWIDVRTRVNANKSYDPDQARDDSGKWTSGGGGGDTGGGDTGGGTGYYTGGATNKEAVNKIIRHVTHELGAEDVAIHVHEDAGRNEVVGGMSGEVAGQYNPMTNQIDLYKAAFEGNYAVDSGTVAHEVTHYIFHAVQKRFDPEFAAVWKVRSKEAQEGIERRDSKILNVDGTLKREADRKRYPTFEALNKYTETDALHEMAKADGVTQYSKQYWQEDTDNPRTAINETLAEVAYIKTSDPKHYEKRVAPIWRQYYADLNKVYRSIRSKAGKSALMKSAPVNGKPRVSYLDAEHNLVSPNQATLIIVVYPDGRREFIVPKRETVKDETEAKSYNPDQPRADDGKWTSGGGGGGSGDGGGGEASGGEGSGDVVAAPAAPITGYVDKHAENLINEERRKLDAMDVPVHVDNEQGKVFDVAGHEFREAAHYNIQDQQVTLFADAINSNSKDLKGIVAHEITHHVYYTVRDAFYEESKKVSERLHQEAANHVGYRDSFLRPDGSLRNEEDKAKYPVYANMQRHFEMRTAEQQKADGVTEYSKSYWEAKDWRRERAVTETLSEVAYIKTADPEHFTKRVSGVWGAYYRDMKRTYSEMKKRARRSALAAGVRVKSANMEQAQAGEPHIYYLDDEHKLVTPDQATLVKIVYPDGSFRFFLPKADESTAEGATNEDTD